jgi:dihydrofolate reductase
MSGFWLIAALSCEHGGIGLRNELPWTKRLHADLTFFRFLTSAPWHYSREHGFTFHDLREHSLTTAGASSSLIMGRKTFDSLVSQLGMPPFKDRQAIVLTRTANPP